jgi:hypothetical protein
LAALPIVGEAIKKRQGEAFEPWNREIYRDVLGNFASTPDAARVVTKGGQKGFAEVDDYLSKAWNVLDANRLNIGGEKMRGYQVRESLNQLEKDIRFARRNGMPDVAKTKQDALNDLRTKVPRAWLDAYDTVSQTYAELMTVGKAGRYKSAREQGGVFSPRELLQATAARDKSKAFDRGENMMQRRAQEAQRAIGASYPNMAEQVVNPLVAGGAVVAGGPLVAAGLAGASIPFATKVGGTWARGQIPGQRNIREIEDALAKLGLRGSSVGGAYGATKDEDEDEEE